MNAYAVTVVVLLVLCAPWDVYGDELDITEIPSSRIDFKMVLNKLDRIVEMQIEMQTKLSADIRQLSESMEKRIAEVTIQQSQSFALLQSNSKQERKYLKHQISEVVRVIGEQNRTIVGIRQLSENIDKKIGEVTMKQDQESFNENESGVVSVINEQNRTTVQVHLAPQDRPESVKMQEESIEQKLNEVANQMTYNVSALQAQLTMIDHSAKDRHEEMAKVMQKLASKEDLDGLKVDPNSYNPNISNSSCKHTNLTGKYMVQPTSQDVPFLVNCEQTAFGGGWLVFQYRYNGEVDFFRNWTEYRDGFGSLDTEFWLGLERLHRLTTARPHELLVELKDFDGNYIYALYNRFEIGSEGEEYPLKKLGSYEGTAGDSLGYHRYMKFSTNDRDNDAHPIENCAYQLSGAWWYKDCHNSNLNGIYKDIGSIETVNWYHYKINWQGLAYTRMLIREI